MKPEEIVRRQHMAESSRNVLEEILDLIERYIAPYRGKFFKDERSESSIEWRRPFVYDSTAIVSAQHLASSLHSSLTSPSTRWFDYKFQDKELKDSKVGKEWLEECAKLVYTALQESNFNIEINEVYQDLVDFGTAAIMEEMEEIDGEEELVFKSIPMKEIFFDEDHKGNVVNFYRKFEWTVLQIITRFGEENLPDSFKDEYKSEGYNNDKKHVVILGIYKRFDIDQKAAKGKKNLAAKKRPYGWAYVLETDPSMILGEEGGYYEMPVFVPRWRTTSSSMWGNSPAMLALSDTLTLNRMIELDLIATEKALDPPILTTARGLVGDLNLNAGGLNTVRDINEMTTFESKARFDVTDNRIARVQNNIKEYFFINQLMLPPMGGTPATATEITIRMQQLERLIGPTLGRLQNDLLDKVVTRTFRILARKGLLPEVPEEIRDTEGGFEIQYSGPLAKTQEASQVQRIVNWVATAGQIAEFDPEVLDNIDFDGVLKETGSLAGIPEKLLKDPKVVASERQERQQQQEQMMQAQQQAAEGAAMQEVGKGQQAIQEAE